MASSLSNPKAVKEHAGHLEVIGETAAKLRLFEHGWNPYSRFLDVDKVDLILRRNRNNTPQYREIQVKYRRLWEGLDQSAWEAKLFSTTAWYTVDLDAFARHRAGFFIMFVFGYPDRRIEQDVLIFPSQDFHKIIERSPLHKKGADARALYISKSISDSRWFIRLTRKKFSKIDSTTCVDVTRYKNNFAALD